MNASKLQLSRQRGMSLAEVLVASAIFTIIILAILMIYDRSNRVFKTSVESAEMQQSTRAGFDRLVSDVRMAGFDADRDGVPNRAAAGPWQPSTLYAINSVVSPTISNNFSYRAVGGGITGAVEPSPWPTAAGSTFSGDGSVTWVALGPVFQQPDEQVEFAGLSAITTRGNFDYTTDAAREHGRENNPANNYEPAGGQFPIVTTGNDEIVTYALRSNSGPNNDTLQFWADTSRPRSVYPGGSAEVQVQIPNVDLCTTGCNNPPYTLMRFALDVNGSPTTAVPVAGNIRSLRFFYYNDIAGTTTVTQADGTVITQGAIGGDGRFDPANVGGTTNWDHRQQRATIASVRVELIGMNEQPDGSYTNPAESITAFKKYRTYTLQSHVSPRNLGLSGMAEPDISPPGPPVVTSACVGACNVTRVSWNPPLVGVVDTYEVRWDTNQNGAYSNIGVVVPGDVVTAPVFDLNPGTLYHFKVVAVNDNGRAISSSSLSRSPVNSTRPGPVTSLTASSGATAQPSFVNLAWTAPVNNDPSLATVSCAGLPLSGATIDPSEPIRYRVFRGDSLTFNSDIGEGTVVLNQVVAAQPTGSGGSTISWVDDFTNSTGRPPANCKRYFYRVQTYDTCALSTDPQANNPNSASTGTSTVFPAIGDDAIAGYASSTVAPTAPGQPTIDYSGSNSTCNRVANTCDVKLVWPTVTTDTSNPTQRITVDQYRITRAQKKFSDTTWSPETALEIFEGASAPANVEGPNTVYHDTTARDHEPGDRRKWYYRYTITALQCGAASANSPAVEFPASCGLALSTVIESGARSGNGSPATPWVMGPSDGIEVIPPAAVSLDRVTFEIYPDGDLSGTPLDRQNANSPPFAYGWQTQTTGVLYRVVITMTNSLGCTEQTDRYIVEDDSSCPSSTITQTGASSGGGVVTLPWFMDLGDQVTVNPPAGGPISNVTFSLIDTTTSTIVGLPIVDSTLPFVYTWSNQIDNRTYRLQMSILYADGCSQVLDRFITDEAPPVCIGASMSATGATSGDGLASTTPWLVNGGDVLTMVVPTGGVINQTVFTITPVTPAGAALAPTTDSTAPFTLTWTDRTDLTIYKVDAVITYSSGCTETVTRFVRDQICAGGTVAQVGSVGAGTGLTTTSPWVFDASDTVTVSAPAGATIQNVTFNLYNQPGTTAITTSTDSATPFVDTWVNRTDDALYRYEMVVTYAAGCTETITRYVRDQGKCFISAIVSSVISSDQGNDRYATITFQVGNPTSEALTITGIAVGWLRDAGHPLAVLQSVSYSGGAAQAVPVANQVPPSTGTLGVSGQATVPANSSGYTVALRYYVGLKNTVSPLTSSWVNSLCLRYTAPSFGGSPASCNVLGSTSGNPSTCN